MLGIVHRPERPYTRHRIFLQDPRCSSREGQARYGIGMGEKWTAISGIMAVGTFVLAPLFFFVTAPPSARELTLMVLAAVFGACVAWFIAVLAPSRDKKAVRVSRQTKLEELRVKAVKLAVEIENAKGTERTLGIQAREARSHRFDDYASESESC